MSNLFPTSRHFFFPETSFFDQAFNSFFTNTYQPNVDIQENEQSYDVSVDLPGMRKEDINVTYHNNVLTIEAHQNLDKEETDEDTNYIRRERVSRSFKRQFVLDHIQFDEIKGKYDNGVLTLHLPKENIEQVENTHRIDID